MADDTQYGRTLFIESLNDNASVTKLERIHLTKNGLLPSAYDEAWLQQLIMHHPNLLPLDQIEPAFAHAVPICMELPSSSGFLDNLLLTPTGNIILIECKLWRNPEARREVIAQIIDYANALSTWTYEKLEQAVCQTKPIAGQNKNKSLFGLVSSSHEIDEPSFIDAVSRNLKRGRFLLLIVGDGIREGVESMTEFLQQHAGLHFTLALVELALLEVPTGGYIVQPRILAKTTNIDRGIVSVEDGRVSIKAPADSALASGPSGRRMTLTRELYFEQLDKVIPGVSERVNAFLDKLTAYNVVPEFGSNSMILRWHPDSTKGWNLGTIASNGDVWLGYLMDSANSRGLIKLSTRYLERLAGLVPEASVKQTPKIAGWYVVLDGKNIKIDALLADDQRANGWVKAIGEFQTSVAESLKGE
jgi:hypothetical protein